MSEQMPPRVGPYEVTARAGRGGMGDVLVARDPSLGRLVAIKRLSPGKEDDPRSLSRFRREARILASLSHPNIATVHALEEDAAGRLFVVLEFVGGETLREVLGRGALSVEEGLRVLSVLADALAAAHGHKVIHRDIKPSNVMIDRHGHPRVLDFGLAKLLAGETGEEFEEVGSEDPTSFRTSEGTLVGTAGYMSPEQICGEALDATTDLFSLGCVAFEMFTGRRPFEGPDKKRVLSATLTRDPDWRMLPRELQPSFVSVLKRCMEKEPRRRMSDAKEVRAACEAALRSLGREPERGVGASVRLGRVQPRAKRSVEQADLLGETYDIAEDDVDESGGFFLCHSCGRSHAWVPERVGEEFFCTCGAKLRMPELIPGEVDVATRKWLHAVDQTTRSPDFRSAASDEARTEGEGPQRRRRRTEVKLGPIDADDHSTEGVVRSKRARASRPISVVWVLVGLGLVGVGFFCVVMALQQRTQMWMIVGGVVGPTSLIWLIVSVNKWCAGRGLVSAISDEIEALG